MPDCGEQQLVFHIENMEQPSATARPYKTDRLNWFSDNLCIFFLFFFSLYCRKREKKNKNNKNQNKFKRINNW